MPIHHEFGPFRLDSGAEILYRGTEPVAVGQRAVALLRVLVERAGTPVAKEALIEAAWPGLAVEESNLTVQIAALRRVFSQEAGGERWIETLPRRGYRFVGPVETADAEAGRAENESADASPALPLPDRPSISVLPFENLSGDPEQEYFADGIVEEIITALSRFRHLVVMARNSSFTYKGRSVDVKQIGRELGVRYVLEGSVRKATNRVRISGQLVDASTGAHLWADRFDGELEDIFELQDKVTESVVGAIAPKLEQAEIQRAKRKPTGSLDAYDFYLRGMASVHKATREANKQALQSFYRAIELDPEFAPAYGMAAWCYSWRKLNRWVEDREAEIVETERLARLGAELSNDDAVALAMCGHALAYVVGDVENGNVLTDRALVMNPNFAPAWLLSGWVRVYLGEPEVAIERMERANRLSPFDPFLFVTSSFISFCHLICGRYDEASSWAERGLREHPNWAIAARVVAASYALAGQTRQAQEAMTRLRRLDPELRISQLKELMPVRRPEDLSTYEEGLRKAGLPE